MMGGVTTMGEYRAGTLVWVLRKNGSWWPGRVVGPNELRARSRTTSITTTNTPVKLLGKTNASVVWFNLEKSKRIKAFRCGEFDECIARAESSQGYRCIKSVKYAYREDAILHALQLEKQEVMKRHKRPGEEFQGAIFRAKRSRCVYFPNKSSKCSSTVSDHQSSMVPPFIAVSDSSVQSGSTGGVTSSRPRGCKSFASDFQNREKDKSVTQASGQTEMRNPDGSDVQGGSANCKEHGEKSYSANFLQKSQTSGVEVQKWNVHGKVKVQISRKLPEVVKTGRHDGQDFLIGCSSNGHRGIESTPRSWDDLVLEVNTHSLSAVQGPGSPNRSETMLIDIEVTVQASYRGEHVPLVSLMSRLNGRAIIGHPIEIEASEVNFSEIDFPKSYDVGGKLFDDVGSMKPQPVWRSSKRTPVSYLPLPHKHVKACENSVNSRLNTMRKSDPLVQEQLLQNQLKKRNLPDQYHVNGGNPGPSRQSCTKDTLLKSGKTATTRVTCVPVELVFSRLHEAVGWLHS